MRSFRMRDPMETFDRAMETKQFDESMSYVIY